MAEQRTRRGPAPTYNREDITRAAVRMADRDGLAAVTMRSLATEVGTGGGALYRYVASRDELLGLMVDSAMSELPARITSSGNWERDLTELAEELLIAHRRHPWLVDVHGSGVPLGAAAVDYLETCLRLLEPVSAPTTAKLEAAALIIGIVTLFTRQESGVAPVGFPTVTPDRWPLLAEALEVAPADAAPRAGLFGRVVLGAVRGILAAG